MLALHREIFGKKPHRFLIFSYSIRGDGNTNFKKSYDGIHFKYTFCSLIEVLFAFFLIKHPRPESLDQYFSCDGGSAANALDNYFLWLVHILVVKRFAHATVLLFKTAKFTPSFLNFGKL